VNPEEHTDAQKRLVTAQLGREPRDPWRVSSRCRWGYATTIASPSTLADGTPFPNLVWLTCPFLTERISALESAGAVAGFATLVASDEGLADALRRTDERLREARRVESGGDDACAGVGLAGQRDPLGVKCLHAHAALELVRLGDPIGREVLEQVGYQCANQRCAKLMGAPGTQE